MNRMTFPCVSMSAFNLVHMKRLVDTQIDEMEMEKMISCIKFLVNDQKSLKLKPKKNSCFLFQYKIPKITHRFSIQNV